MAIDASSKACNTSSSGFAPYSETTAFTACKSSRKSASGPLARFWTAAFLQASADRRAWSINDVGWSPNPKITPAPSCDNVPVMSTCFVVMPYSEVFREYYQDIFHPAIEAVGLSPVLAEAQFIAQGMIDQVVAGIRSSKIVIADVTDERPNVFYEMGLAHARVSPSSY